MTTNSEHYSELCKVTPGGSQTLSKMPCRFVRGVYPEVLTKGFKAHVWDAEGHEYIDLISGLGAVSVGYSDPVIDNAVWQQMGKGVSFSLPHPIEGQVARKLCELVPGTEMWKFGKNGTDATVMAVRAARAHTGRMNIITVGYSGCADVFEAIGTRQAGIPVKELAPLNHRATYNDIESFTCLRDESYACVIMEPMVYEYPKPGFLEALRDLCTTTGTLLIFDEVVTGGRFEQFVAQSYFKVMPDLTCLGKAIANGFPLSAVGGLRAYMSTFERDDFFASGTFGGETVSLAACLATVDRLQKDIAHTIEIGTEIQWYFNNTFGDFDAECVGYPTRFIFKFPSKAHSALFMQEMCINDVLIGHANMAMTSLTHWDIGFIRQAIIRSYLVLKQFWSNPEAALNGPLPTDAFLRKS